MATLDLMRVGGRNSRWESAVAFEYNYFLAKLSVFTKFNRVSRRKSKLKSLEKI